MSLTFKVIKQPISPIIREVTCRVCKATYEFQGFGDRLVKCPTLYCPADLYIKFYDEK